jgi:hypothetical protein
MKKSIVPMLVLMTVYMVLLPISQAQGATGQTQEPAVQSPEAVEMGVSVAAICTDVQNLEPINASTSFPATVGKLYCFTKITGAQSPTQITHVWYFDGTERAKVDLAVNSVSWRTYSSKIIQSYEMGAWSVEVLDSNGKVLKTLEFEVRP